MSYLKRHGTRRVPQSEPLPGQVPNSDVGYSWPVDGWARLHRFLVLGSEGGSYYASERTLTRENAKAVDRCLAEDGQRTVDEIVAVSREGRAPKNDPALFALAMAAGSADHDTRKAALDALPLVARTGTHLFRFATFVEQFRGWGRALRRAVGRWYASRRPDEVAYQAVKYRRREGVTHRDLLRLAHPARTVSAGNPTLDVTREHAALFEWIVRGGHAGGLPRTVEGFARAQAAEHPADSAAVIREYGLPRLLALDVSGSMTTGWVAGVLGLTPRDASAALALVTAATEPHYEIVGFFTGKGGFKKQGPSMWSGYEDGLTPLAISPRQRLDDAIKTVSDLPFGGTDCALPMLYAQATEREVDAFVIYTDSETWAGVIHPAQALRAYRRASGIDARLVVVGMVSNAFSIADPNDPGMLNVVGFDTATPQLISDFARGAL